MPRLMPCTAMRWPAGQGAGVETQTKLKRGILVNVMCSILTACLTDESISFPRKRTCLNAMLEKVESFVKRLRWKAYFLRGSGRADRAPEQTYDANCWHLNQISMS